MTPYLLSAAVACGLSAAICYFLIKFASRKHIFMPAVRKRDVHTHPVPRVGGIAIVTAFLVVTLVTIIIAPESLAFTDNLVVGVDQNLLGLILATILLAAINIADDFKDVAWPIKLGFQVFAALLIFFFGINTPWLTSPFEEGKLLLGGAQWLFVVVWLVGLSNVVNWLDGVDGLAGGVTAIGLAILFFLSISQEVNQPSTALLAAIAFGAVVGFLPFNIVSSIKAFLGDTGSIFLGFLIGVLAIISGGKVATAFLVLAIPFLDALVVLIGRLLSGESPFHPDKRHLHHRLLALGMKPAQIVTVFYGFTLVFGLVALNTQLVGKLRAALFAVALMALLVVIYTVGPKLRQKNERRKLSNTK
jgi:UDP-GlcNAc:undecaprenyl-phosphate GlcNAc-1-phosphate transferase